MKKKSSILLAVIGIIGLIVITVGVTYAFFNYVKKGSEENVLTTGTITFLYTEIDKVGSGISIKDAYPISDSQGKMLSGTNEVFDFKITSNTATTSSIPYEITARKKAGSTLDESAVKLYLTKVVGDSEEEVLLDKYSSLTQTSRVTEDKYTEKTMYTGKVPANSTNYEQAFKLRMWIDKDVNFSQLEDGSYPYNDKEFTVTVNVYANAKVVTEQDKLDAAKAEISSIKIEDTELTKVENQNYDYEISLPSGTTSTTLDIETTNEYATVKVERIDSLASTSNIKRLSVKKTVNLTAGDNYFKVTVTSADGKVDKEYKVKIKVKEPGILLSQSIFNQYSNIQENATLDKTSEEVNENGLFKSTATNSGDPTYYFRGNVENYIDFAGFTWRIIRINEDGTIRLIMQDGINNNTLYKFNPQNNNYTQMYYTNSNIENGAKYILDNWYNENIKEKGYDINVATGGYFCEQAKVRRFDKLSFGNATMLSYKQYVPNFICEPDNNVNGIVTSNIGLITYDEISFAGGYFNINNSNYYLHSSVTSYTMSPAGSRDDGYDVWGLYFNDGEESVIFNSYVSNEHVLKPVINLKSNVTVTGTGKSDDHWVVQ